MASTPATDAARGDDPFARAALGARTGYLLIKLGDVVWGVVEDALEPSGLKPRQFNVLASISVHAGFSQRDLADLHNVDPNTMVTLVDELEARNFVTRRRSERDRRRHEMTLTKKGARVLDEAFALIESAEREFFAPLTRAEARQLHDMVHRLLLPWWPPRRRES
jgi:DNA-binding MarR family transcriptional regulator